MQRTNLRAMPFALALAFAAPALPQNAPANQSSDAHQAIDAAAVHHIKTVFVIVMENHNWTGDGSSDIKGNSAAPYINYTLIPMASYANNYNNPPGIHPSLPNYLWMEGGSSFGVRTDDTPQQFHVDTSNHLVTMLEKAGISWKAYEEDISGSECPIDGRNQYAPKHDPFVYFDDVTGHLNAKSSYCIDHIRPFTELAGDLKDGKIGRYNFITPNECDDMHSSCGGDAIANGDEWLKKNLPAILNSSAYHDGGAIFITWDEANRGDGPIPMIVLSPYAKGNRYSNSVYYTHSSLLRTVQEIFGASPLIRWASTAQDLHDLFQVFP